VRIYLELLVFFIGRRLFMLLPMAWRTRLLRAQGVTIGEGCIVHTPYFGVEPWLVVIGDRVAISSGVEFITHDAVGFLFPDQPHLGAFGAIRVGGNTFFGMKCIVMPNTTIGSNCVIGAGSVVRGTIPDNSVVMGNPAKVIMTTPALKALLVNSPNRFDTHLMSTAEKRRTLRRHFGLE
jgi:hypothetical protein